MSNILCSNLGSASVINFATGTVTAADANTTVERTFTVPGLLVGDLVYVRKPTHQAGLGIVGARVSAADTLAVVYMNNTASPITPASETCQILWIRPDATKTTAN